MTELNTYLYFGGQCAEAMEFYKSIFGVELTLQTRGSVDPNAPDDMKDLLIHAELSGGEVHLLAADNLDAGSNKPQYRISLTLNGSDEPKLRKFYDSLAAGGSADHPLKKEFWGDTFGNLTDKYGISWMVNILAVKPADTTT